MVCRECRDLAISNVGLFAKRAQVGETQVKKGETFYGSYRILRIKKILEPALPQLRFSSVDQEKLKPCKEAV